MKKKVTRYTAAQRAEAVAAFNGGETQDDIAKRLGAHKSSVGNWVKAAKKTGKAHAEESGSGDKIGAFSVVCEALETLSKQDRLDVLTAAQVLFQ